MREAIVRTSRRKHIVAVFSERSTTAARGAHTHMQASRPIERAARKVHLYFGSPRESCTRAPRQDSRGTLHRGRCAGASVSIPPPPPPRLISSLSLSLPAKALSRPRANSRRRRPPPRYFFRSPRSARARAFSGDPLIMHKCSRSSLALFFSSYVIHFSASSLRGLEI